MRALIGGGWVAGLAMMLVVGPGAPARADGNGAVEFWAVGDFLLYNAYGELELAEAVPYHVVIPAWPPNPCRLSLRLRGVENPTGRAIVVDSRKPPNPNQPPDPVIWFVPEGFDLPAVQVPAVQFRQVISPGGVLTLQADFDRQDLPF